MQCTRRRMEDGERCHVKVRRGMGGRFGWCFSSLCVRHQKGGRCRTRVVGALCARAADGVALLSCVGLALPLLYHSHCTLLTDEREREREAERFGGWGKRQISGKDVVGKMGGWG